MRYNDWDILLFPRDCKVPMKEFKVACHVIHDAEFAHTHGSFGVPVVTCFVPSLAAGTPFQVSMHSWNFPSISQFTKSYTKYPESVKFEARLFIDGCLIASTTLTRKNGWPHILAHSFDFSKMGDLEPLKFPPFRHEILQQNYWSPADDIGRIKVVISEGFPRDSQSMPIERVKNIVAFSFQHAPLEVLEASSIAWPNPAMWRRSPLMTSMPVPTYSSDDCESHAHSPRRRIQGGIGVIPGYATSVMQGVAPIQSPTRGSTQKPGFVEGNNAGLMQEMSYDPVSETKAYFDWLNNSEMSIDDTTPRYLGEPNTVTKRRAPRKSSTDASMPDYISSADSSHFTFPNARQAPPGFQIYEEPGSMHTKVPTNTPTARGQESSADEEAVPFNTNSRDTSFPPKLAECLTQSLLNQPLPNLMHGQQVHIPAPEVKSRKENRARNMVETCLPPRTSSSTVGQEHQELRKVSQQMYISPSGGMPVGAIPSQIDGTHIQPSDLAQSAPYSGTPAVEIGSLPSQNAALTMISGNKSEKSTKRGRIATPSSSKAADDDYESQASPHTRFASYMEDTSRRTS